MGCVRFSSAPCFRKRCYSRIRRKLDQGACRQQGAWVNLSPKRNRKDPTCFSAFLYRAHNLIERFINKMNNFGVSRPDMKVRNKSSGVRQTRITGFGCLPVSAS